MADFNAINRREQEIRELGGVPERWIEEIIEPWRRRQETHIEGMTRGENLAGYEIQTLLDQLEEMTQTEALVE